MLHNETEPLQIIFAELTRIQYDLYEQGCGWKNKPSYVISDMFISFEQASRLDVSESIIIGIRDRGVDTDKDFLLLRDEKEYLTIWKLTCTSKSSPSGNKLFAHKVLKKTGGGI